jgi:hypothetical protein
MSTIKIYGYSDDLVEIDGDISAEFDSYDQPTYLLFNDGTQVKVEYSDGGIWKIEFVTTGEAQGEHLLGLPDGAPEKQCHGDKDAPSYSDVVTLTWDKPFELVKRGRKKLSAPPQDIKAIEMADKVIKIIEATHGGEYFIHEIDSGEDGNEDTYEDFKARLIQLFVSPVSQSAPCASIAGKVFVITGTLSMARAEAIQKIVAAGGEVASTVSTRVDYLVYGDDPGTKLDRAIEKGVTTLNEAQFMEMIK